MLTICVYCAVRAASNNTDPGSPRGGERERELGAGSTAIKERGSLLFRREGERERGRGRERGKREVTKAKRFYILGEVRAGSDRVQTDISCL